MKHLKTFLLSLCIMLYPLSSYSTEQPSPKIVKEMKVCPLPGEALPIQEKYVLYSGSFLDNYNNLTHVLSVTYGAHSVYPIYAKDEKPVMIGRKRFILTLKDNCFIITELGN